MPGVEAGAIRIQSERSTNWASLLLSTRAGLLPLLLLPLPTPATFSLLLLYSRYFLKFVTLLYSRYQIVVTPDWSNGVTTGVTSPELSVVRLLCHLHSRCQIIRQDIADVKSG